MVSGILRMKYFVYRFIVSVLGIIKIIYVLYVQLINDSMWVVVLQSKKEDCLDWMSVLGIIILSIKKRNVRAKSQDFLFARSTFSRRQ
jgi:hypothetical protein